MKQNENEEHASNGKAIWALRLKLSGLIKKRYASTFLSRRVRNVYHCLLSTAFAVVVLHYYEWAGAISYLGDENGIY